MIVETIKSSKYWGPWAVLAPLDEGGQSKTNGLFERGSAKMISPAIGGGAFARFDQGES